MWPARTLLVAPLLAAALLPWLWRESPAQPRPSLKPHVAPNRLYMRYKPADWTVAEDPQAANLRVSVQAPDGLSMVDFFWSRNPAKTPNALAVLVFWKQQLSRQHGDVTLADVFVSPDASRATASLRYRTPAGFVAGKHYVESRPEGQSAQGYRAPEGRLAAPRRAQDGSLAIRVPADWAFLAGGGRVLTAAPDGAMGFIFRRSRGTRCCPRRRSPRASSARGSCLPPRPWHSRSTASGTSSSAFTPPSPTRPRCASVR